MLFEERATGGISWGLRYIPLHVSGLPEGRVPRAAEGSGQRYCMDVGTEKAFCGNSESPRDRCDKTRGLGVLWGILLSVTKAVANKSFLALLLPNEEENRK